MRILNQKTGQQRFLPDGEKVALAENEIALYAGKKEPAEGRRVRLRAGFLKAKFIETAIKLTGASVSAVAQALGIRPCAACQMRALVTQKVDELGYERAFALLKQSFKMDEVQMQGIMDELQKEGE